MRSAPVLLCRLTDAWVVLIGVSLARLLLHRYAAPVALVTEEFQPTDATESAVVNVRCNSLKPRRMYVGS